MEEKKQLRKEGPRPFGLGQSESSAVLSRICVQMMDLTIFVPNRRSARKTTVLI